MIESSLVPSMKRPAAAMSVMKKPSAASTLPKPAWYDVPDEKARLQNYLISAAKLVNDEDNTTSEVPLQDPAKITKEQFQAALFDSFNNHIYGFGRPRTRPVELDVYFGVKEGPEQASHHHAGISFYKQEHQFLPFKLAMRQRHGIATHWSTSHTKRRSIIRYLHSKPVVDPHPLEWTRDGRKLNLAHECEEPFVARLWNSDRELRVSDPFDPKKSKKRESFTKLDLSAMVVSEQLQTPCAVLTHVMTKGTKTMKLWVHMRQSKLKQFIREAYDLEGAKLQAELEKESEWKLIERFARDVICEALGATVVGRKFATIFPKLSITKDRLRVPPSPPSSMLI